MECNKNDQFVPKSVNGQLPHSDGSTECPPSDLQESKLDFSTSPQYLPQTLVKENNTLKRKLVKISIQMNKDKKYWNGIIARQKRLRALKMAFNVPLMKRLRDTSMACAKLELEHARDAFRGKICQLEMDYWKSKFLFSEFKVFKLTERNEKLEERNEKLEKNHKEQNIKMKEGGFQKMIEEAEKNCFERKSEISVIKHENMELQMRNEELEKNCEEYKSKLAGLKTVASNLSSEQE